VWLRWAVDDGASGEGIGAAIPAPAPWVVAWTGVLAVMVTVSSVIIIYRPKRSLLSVLNILGTVIHEAGHALTAVVTGGGVRHFEITDPHSGGVVPEDSSWLSTVLTGAAGYAMPPLAGVGAAWLLHRGHAPAVLALTVVVLVILLLFGSDNRTRLSVLALGLVPFATLFWGTPALQNFIAYTETWLLLTSEIGGLIHLVGARMNGPLSGNDADILARKTLVPGSVWIAGWALLIGWGLWTGAPLLSSRQGP
jgi:hypothetical protein